MLTLHLSLGNIDLGKMRNLCERCQYDILILTLFVHALSEYCRMVLFARASPLHVAEAISTAAQALPTAVEKPVFVCCRL